MRVRVRLHVQILINVKENLKKKERKKGSCTPMYLWAEVSHVLVYMGGRKKGS